MNRLAKLICDNVLLEGSFLLVPLLPGFSRRRYEDNRMTNEIYALADGAVKRIVNVLGNDNGDLRSRFDQIEEDIYLNGQRAIRKYFYS
jgi:hypothetical protein